MTSLRVEVAELKEILAQECPPVGIELAGAVALPCPMPHRDRWLRWVDDGRDADLEYLTRDPEGRVDPTVANPWAKSLLVMAHRYTAGWPAHDPDPSAGGTAAENAPWSNRVSRYARGRDYHDFLLKAMKRLLRPLRDRWPDLRAHPATDTGPYLEREYAWLAGFGFLGHNRCLIHEKLGSGVFLGVVPTNMEIDGLGAPGLPVTEPLYAITRRWDRPVKDAPWDRCGTCTLCLDACPTAALDIEKGLDAHRCLSTWTIEWRGKAPAGGDSQQGELLFGCDICQAVCPWNRKAARELESYPPVAPEYAALEDHASLKLADLLHLNDDEFRSRFRKTPIWRCHPEGLRRNAERVLRNIRQGDEK